MNGREKEVSQIVEFDRAVEIANLMLGKLNRLPKPIYLDEYLNLPRRQLKSGAADVKRRKKEVEKFCRNNFELATPKKLAALYEPIVNHKGTYRLPMLEFVKKVGTPRNNALKGAPSHATVCISPWGLQTEFPEMHLAKDLLIAFNFVLSLHKEYERLENSNPTWKVAKTIKSEIQVVIASKKYHMRTCMLCCFNLVEAYINGIAWAFMQEYPETSLSNGNRKILEGDQTSIVDKLIKIPKIVTGGDISPLDKEKPPLSIFKERIKPFRDSIVHASPYSALERYGGYDKLSKIYDLDLNTVRHAVELTIEIISTIHRFIGEETDAPLWLPIWNDDGSLHVT